MPMIGRMCQENEPILKNNTDFSDHCADYFAAQGPLAQAIEGFAPRKSQVDLTRAIAFAMQTGKHLIAEAGTGTGKTYAYLIPALTSGTKTIISTGTKNLQDQLFKRDLPLIQQALGKPIKVALLKGRDNYLCHFHIDRHLQNPALTQKEFGQLQKIRQKLGGLKQGEKQEISGIEENDTVFHYAVSTKDNCLNQECEFYQQCFLMKARRKAMEADIVVVNHHLLFADLLLKDEGVGELLPKAKALILDEAHQIPEIASRFLSKHVSTRQLAHFMDMLILTQTQELPDLPGLGDAARQLQGMIPALRAVFGEAGSRGAINPKIRRDWQMAVQALKEAFIALNRLLAECSGRSKIFEQLHQEAAQLYAIVDSLLSEAPPTQIHWYEAHHQSVIIYHTPLILADVLKPYLQQTETAWIFTSATLTVHNDFKHFVEQLGLQEATTLQLDSPFDYPNQGLLYVPRGLPDPRDSSYLQQLIQQIIPLIEAAKGRSFLLFTSHAALQQAAIQLRASTLDYPLFVQGEGSKDYLLSAFREAGNGVLLGTSSFWEGVDVRGQALSCVVIDKLPFSSPDDPILQARQVSLKKQGKKPFDDYQLPQAVIALKQGAGRLIRDYQDKGVLVIGDPRLLARDYGRTFLASLPPKTRTRDLNQVLTFLGAC